MTTETIPQPADAPDPATQDPRLTIAGAIEIATTAIAAVTPDQLDNPTPCTEFSVRDLLGHLVMVLRRIEAVGNGRDPMSVPEETTDVEGDDWSSAWSAAAELMAAAWTEDAKLAKEVVFPWATLPGGAALIMYTSEISVHTWDLAQATGQQPTWDDAILNTSYEFMQQALPGNDRQASFEDARANMPAEFADFAPPFLNVVPVPDGAPVIDRLVAWNGRRP